SLRKTAVCGMRRLAMLRTRSACTGSLLTLPLGVSVLSTSWYWAAAALSRSADETRRSWLRWTPTEPSSVVVVQATRAVVMITTTAARPTSRLFMWRLLTRAADLGARRVDCVGVPDDRD